MSSNMRNQPDMGKGNGGRAHDDSNRESRYEGFEGMNYEQVRQPYNPQQKPSGSNSNRPRRSPQKGGQE